MKILALVLLVVSFVFGAVDINTAGKQELMSLNGIGDKKADAIIAYRDANCLKNVDELTNVKGIGTKFMEKNKTNLKISACKK